MTEKENHISYFAIMILTLPSPIVLIFQFSRPHSFRVSELIACEPFIQLQGHVFLKTRIPGDSQWHAVRKNATHQYEFSISVSDSLGEPKARPIDLLPEVCLRDNIAWPFLTRVSNAQRK